MKSPNPQNFAAGKIFPNPTDNNIYLKNMPGTHVKYWINNPIIAFMCSGEGDNIRNAIHIFNMPSKLY